MAGELGSQSVRAAAAWPWRRQRRGADTTKYTARVKIPNGRACTGLLSRLLYSYRVQNQGSWHIRLFSKELLPPTPGLDIPYLFLLAWLCAMG